MKEWELDDRRGLYADYYRDSFPSPHDPVSCCPDSVGLKVLQVLSLDEPSRVSNFTSHGEPKLGQHAFSGNTMRVEYLAQPEITKGCLGSTATSALLKGLFPTQQWSGPYSGCVNTALCNDEGAAFRLQTKNLNVNASRPS